jgi:hypothetical protein
MTKTDLLRRAGADLSPCGRWRWRLERRWDGRELGEDGALLFVMLNPSTADAERDDPTIRRCIRFATDAGAGALVVCNLFALRATDPDTLLREPDPIGPENDAVLAREAARAGRAVMAFGRPHPRLAPRARQVAAMLAGQGTSLQALALTQEGWPRHPLYLSAFAMPSPWHPPTAVTPTSLP